MISPLPSPNGTCTRATQGGLISITPCRYLCGGGIWGRGLAGVLLVVSLPVVIALIVLTRLTSRGPGLYRQVRVGKYGRIFVMYKIRSMVEDAEATTGPVWTQDDRDPRITAFGYFLRKSHLDELPQLYNVVRGEMSLFGPRPERPEIVHVLAESIPGYLDRLAVRPGITGLAQSNLPPDSSLESVRRKLQLDLEYIARANLWLDVRMLFWTKLRLLGVPASLATRQLGLRRNVKPVMATSAEPVSIAQLIASRRRNRQARGAEPPRAFPPNTQTKVC